MKILKMTASFGCLAEQTMEPDQGLHVEVLPNESGKSTWAAFLLAMFYGIDSAERASRGKLPAKVRYKPWSGLPMEGTLLLEQDGRQILLQRTSEHGRPMDTFRAYDPQSGREISGLTGENCGRTLMGVGREVFRRTAFLSGEELQVTREEELAARLANLAAAGSMEESAAAVRQRLKVWKHRLSYHGKGLIPETEAALTEHRKNLARGQDMEARRQELLRQADLLRESAVPTEKKRNLLPLWLLLILLGAAVGLAVMQYWVPMAAAVLASAAVVVLFHARSKKAAAAQTAARQRQEELHRLETEAAVLAARSEQMPSPAEGEALLRELEEYRYREQALELAFSALSQAEEELERGYGPRLTACAGKLLSALTRDRYDAMTLDRELSLSLRERESGLLRPLAALSRGTREQAWLALRLAMTELLLPPGTPLVLDDALLTFDEERTAAAMDVLASRGTQVLVFSCREL